MVKKKKTVIALKTRKKKFTLKEAGLTAAQAAKLVADGRIKRVGVLRGRGRPAILYSKV